MTTQSEQTFYQNATSNPLLVKKLVRNNEKINLALNPNTPIEVLIGLSKDEYWEVRKEVALNPNTPIEILKKLSKDEDEYVRYYVAKNLNTPIDILTNLSKDEEFYVRNNVADNPNTPKETLIELSKDEDYWVRLGVAMNLNTPLDTLQELSKDKEENVKRIAIETLNKVGISENKIAIIETKISNNKNTLGELFKEKNIDPNGKIGLELLKVYNDTQDKLNQELEDLKSQVVDIATNDFNSL